MLSVVVQVLPAHLDWLEALAAGDDVFTARFCISVVDGWVGFPEALPLAVEGARERSEDEWGTHLFFDDVNGALVGFGGFKGEPRHGEVELGYAIAPSRRGRGIATAVVGVLVERARCGRDQHRDGAHARRRNASTAVLRKNGFVRAGDVDDPGEGTVWRWELPMAAAGDRQHHD